LEFEPDPSSACQNYRIKGGAILVESAKEREIPAKIGSIKSIHLILLLAALVAGGFCRFHQIARQSLWEDEYWSVYRATGRDKSLFLLPRGVLMDPPSVGLQNAPSWLHIWPNIAGYDSHPPLYYILLRGWMDLFGESDFATRSFSAVASLAGAIVLFDICRRLHGPWIAVAAATVLALSPAQIIYSQEARSYPLIVFELLLCADAIAMIARKGPTPRTLAILGVFTTISLLTNYFTLFALFGMGLYVLMQLQGSTRRRTLLAMIAGGAVAAIAWGPFILQERSELDPSWLIDHHPGAWVNLIVQAIGAPAMQLYGPEAWPNPIAIAVIVFLIPLLAARRKPEVMLWWLWLVTTVAIILILDLSRHTKVITVLRYTFLAAPPIFVLALTALPFRKTWGAVLAIAVVMSVAIESAAFVQSGPPIKPDWRLVARTLNRMAGPHDPIVFYPEAGSFDNAAHSFLGIQRYMPTSTRPVMMLDLAPNKDAQKNVAGSPVIWLMGPAATTAAARYFPGWKMGRFSGVRDVGFFVELIRPEPEAATTVSSR
jgi:hypothetical protein